MTPQEPTQASDDSLSQPDESPYTTPASTSVTEVSWDNYTPSGSQHRPWIRYWARTTEEVCVVLLGGVVIGLIIPEQLEMISDTLLGLVFLCGFRFYEAAMFAAFGTTPFKALFQIRVRHADGRKLSFLDALIRSLKVWLMGEGLGIPLITLVTHITSYRRLVDRGITAWDQSGGLVVTHRKVEWWRWLVWLGLVAGIFQILALSITG